MEQHFNWEKFKEYVNTYDPSKHGRDDADIIMKDMLYGIGISLSEKYRWSEGHQKFLLELKNRIDEKGYIR